MNIAIVGLGVVGGSFAKALRKHPKEGDFIMAIDTDENTIKQALAEKLIDEGETVNRSILQRADIVVIALYPQALIEFMKNHKSDFKEGAIVTDTTGVKVSIIDAVNKVIPETVDFISGHPMAGRENKGLAYASAEVFEDANYLITQTEHNHPNNIALFTELIERLGFRRVTIVSPERHDEMIAFTSQLAHVIAVSLINSDIEGRETALFVGDSYRDLTRIAKLNEDLWSELFLANKDELLKSIDNFENKVKELKQTILNNDQEAMKKHFKEAKSRRLQLEKDDIKFQ